MAEYCNIYGEDDIPRCLGCNKPVRNYEDSIIKKQYHVSKIIKSLWHENCYDKMVIERWYSKED